MIAFLGIACILAAMLGLGLWAGLFFRRGLTDKPITAGHRRAARLGCLGFLIGLPLGIWLLFNVPSSAPEWDEGAVNMHEFGEGD